MHREICPLAPIAMLCFRVRYLDITFTFYTYLGTNLLEATAAQESIEILTGWWKDVLQIFGTSWMSFGSVALVIENIWEIFATWMRRLSTKLLWGLLKSRALHVFRPYVPHFWQKCDIPIFTWIFHKIEQNTVHHFYLIIGPESDHRLCLSLTHWLTHSLPFSKFDWCDLACEDANLKLVEVVTVADVVDDNRVGNSLL